MICLFLALHFALFQRPEDYRVFKALGVAYAIVVCIEIAVALILFIVIGVSECNTESYGVAAILSSLSIVVINGLTLVLGIIYFLSKTRVTSGRVAVEMQPLSEKREDSAREPPKPKPAPPKEEEEPPQQEEPEDMDGIE